MRQQCLDVGGIKKSYDIEEILVSLNITAIGWGTGLVDKELALHV